MSDAPPAESSASFEERYFRKGLGLRQEVRGEVSNEYCSDLIQHFKDSGYSVQLDDTTYRLAQEFGFCYGVERSVDYAYETLKRFPDKRIVLTGEIIHNPKVNGRLRELGIRFYGDEGLSGAGDLTPNDVVILPAFGVATEEMDAVRDAGAVVVDTTCGSVLNVWKNVERYAKHDMTSLVHGKVDHEETRATVSRVTMHGGHYVVVLDMDEAKLVADTIRGRVDAETFLRTFPEPKTSSGFDPAVHLERMGVANQTTMLAGESMAIARHIGEALEEKYGDTSDAARFRSFDTICSATQERQDALRDLIEEPLDLLIVVGGYNSSNTGHLVEMAEDVVPVFHVKGPECLVSPETILHKPVGRTDEVEAHDWLPTKAGAIIGLSSGASTPDAVLGAVVVRLQELRSNLHGS